MEQIRLSVMRLGDDEEVTLCTKSSYKRLFVQLRKDAEDPITSNKKKKRTKSYYLISIFTKEKGDVEQMLIT